MADKKRVCCLCGDVGFPQQLFRCSRCHFRFQHSYCSNYYYGNEPKDNICDWCQFESGKIPSSPSSSSSRTSSKRPSSESYNHLIRSEYTGSRIKIMHVNHHHHHDSTSTVDNNPTTTKPPSKYNPGPSPSPSPSPSGVPSPRPNGHRRYKLLKDVMC